MADLSVDDVLGVLGVQEKGVGYQAPEDPQVQVQPEPAPAPAVAEPQGSAPLSVDDVNSVIVDMDRQRTQRSVFEGVREDPDAYARDKATAQRAGLPVAAVRQDRATVENRLKVNDVMGALDGAPATSEFMQDPENAKVAHSDAAGLSAIEKAWNWYADTYVDVLRGVFWDVPRSLPAGLSQMVDMTLRGVGEQGLSLQRLADRALDPIFGEYDREAFQKRMGFDLNPFSAMKAGGEALQGVTDALTPESDGWGVGLGMGLGQVAGQITLAIVTRGTGSGANLLTLTGQGASQQADMAREAGQYGTAGADLAVLGGGGITALTEKYGLDVLLKYVPSKVKGQIFQILASAGSEGAQEITEQVLQNLAAYSLYNPDQQIINWDELLQQGSVGAGVGGVVSSIIGAGSAYSRARQAQRAAKARDGLLDANAKAMASPLNERSPEKAAEHRVKVLEKEGIESVSIDAQAVKDMLDTESETGLNDPDLAAKLGLTEDGLLEALSVGGEVSLSREAFGSHIYGTPRFEKVVDNLRIKEGEMTPAEAREYQESGLQEEMDQLNAGFDAYDGDVQAQGRQIRDDVEQMLIEAGRSADEAQFGSLLMASEYMTTAERAGMQPIDLWHEDKVRIVGPEGVSRETVDDLTLLLDKAKSTDAETFLKLSKTPAIDWLKSKGGVDPDGWLGQELRLMDVTPKTAPGLFKKGGVGAADNLAQNEADLFAGDAFGPEFNGYIDPQAIVEAVRAEMAGDPKRTADQQANIEKFNADIADLDARLRDTGLSVKDSEADIRKALGASFDQPVNADVDPDRVVDVLDLTALPSEARKPNDLIGEIRGWLKQDIPTADQQRIVRILPKHVRHVVFSGAPIIQRDKRVRNQSIENIVDLLGHAVLIESGPETKGKSGVDSYHRFYVPVWDGKKHRTLRIVVEQTKEGVRVNPDAFDLYDVVVEEKGLAPNRKADKSASQPQRVQGLTTNIRNMLSGVKDTQGRRYFDQPDASGYDPRDSITFDARETLIRMGKSANRSTFLHESGHLFLEHVKRNADRFGGTNPQFTEEWETVKKWWGENAESLRAEAIKYAKKSGDEAAVSALAGMSESQIKAYVTQGNLTGQRFEQGQGLYQGAEGDLTGGAPEAYLTRAMHEQWARGSEDYFRTGQAPSVALQDAFNRFRAWLVSIYKAVTQRGVLDVRFSPEVKAVMDRLLATDEEIALVNEQYDLNPLFKDAASTGMTPAQWRAYQRETARDIEERKTRQLKKHLNEIERETRAWWQEESARVREQEIEPDVHARPVYRALYALAKGTMPNGEAFPDGMRPSRLDRKAVIAIIENEESLKRLPKVGSTGILATNREGGAHPDIVARQYGYDDGRAMLIDLMNAKKMEEVIAEETAARMKQEYGDLLTRPEAMDAALESSHNDKRGDVLTMELNALRDGKEKMKSAFVRKWAKDRIGSFRIGDIAPSKFLTLERKHGREAGKLFRAGDRVGAMRAKFREMAQFFMSQEAYRVRDEVDASRKYLGRFQKSKATFKAIDADYVDRIQSVLALYDLGPRLSERKELELELKALNDWIERVKEDDGAILQVPERIQYSRMTKNYKDMTLDEYRELVSFIKSIEAQGRLKKKGLINKEMRDIDEMGQEMAAHADTRPQTRLEAKKVTNQNADDAFDRGARWFISMDVAMKKVEFLLERLDGEKMGPFKRYLFQPFADAETARNDLTKAVTQRIMKALDNIPKKVRAKLAQKVDVPELGRSFRRSELLMMALNVGNDSNYEKMIEGSEKDITEGARPWTRDGVEAALQNLTKEEWDFVQTVWNSFEAMYPQVEEIYRRENGVAPEKVEARQVETPHGTYAGGYFPMMYAPDRSQKGRQIEQKGALENMQAQAGQASVNSSMTKGRTGFSAPVNLSIDAMPNHIERTAHFITHYETVRTARKLLNHPEVMRSVTNRMGTEYYNLLTDWVNDLAANGQPTEPTKWLGRQIEAMRSNATIAIMGLSYTTMVSQTLGYANSIDALAKNPDGTYSPGKGTLRLMQGMVKYLENPLQAKRTVFALSGEMRHRLENTDREIRHSLKKLAGKKGAWSQMQRFSLMGIAGVQIYMVDMPTWIAGFGKAVAEGYSQKDAIKYADSLVRTSQTAGGLKDLAQVQKEPGATKALTMFYSYFNLLYNMEAEIAGNVKERGVKDIPQAAARVAVLIMLPVVLEGIMRNEWPDDKDDESFAEFTALRAAVYAASSLVGFRDFVGIVDGFGYSVTPLDSLGESLSRAITSAARAFDDGEVTGKDMKSFVSLFGFLFGAPAMQTNRFIDAADAMMNGEDVGPYDFLVGRKQ